MANWKLGKIQYGFLETVTSGGTLILTSSGKQYQIFTGSSSHTLRLPDATTMGDGLNFIVVNLSTGIITVQNNSSSTILSVAAGETAELFLADKSTSDGVWRTFAAGTGSNGGIGAKGPGAAKTSNYTILSSDRSKVINVDSTSGAIGITLPTPEVGFNVTVKDSVGNAHLNPISIIRGNTSITIDGEVNDDIIDKSFGAVSYVSDGVNWFRISSLRDSLPGLGLFGGGVGVSSLSSIEYIKIETLGNASYFGDLTVARNSTGSCSSRTIGVWAGDSGLSNLIDYVVFSTFASAQDYGDLTISRRPVGGCSSSVRGLFGGGRTGGNSTEVNVIDYITFSVLSNATDFGDLTLARSATAACSSSVRGIWAGGVTATSTVQNVIDYVTIATTGNATNFGNLTQARQVAHGCSNAVRGLLAGGYTSSVSNVIDYVTIATTGNATNFGNLTVARGALGAVASVTRGVFAGGYDSPSFTSQNVIDYVTIASLGNATDFGDLIQARSEHCSGCSNAHGGLQ